MVFKLRLSPFLTGETHHGHEPVTDLDDYPTYTWFTINFLAGTKQKGCKLSDPYGSHTGCSHEVYNSEGTWTIQLWLFAEVKIDLFRSLDHKIPIPWSQWNSVKLAFHRDSGDRWHAQALEKLQHFQVGSAIALWKGACALCAVQLPSEKLRDFWTSAFYHKGEPAPTWRSFRLASLKWI